MTNVPMTLPDLVLATHKTPFFHSSTFVELEDGRILHAAGSRFTTSDDGGITWSDISERHDVNGNRVEGGGSSLVKLDGKGIGLAAMAPMDDDDPWTRCVQFWRSPDGGETWEAPVRVSPIGIKTHMYQDVALRTSSGRIILPVYTSSGQRTPPNDVESPASGKLVHNQWVSTAGHFFDPGYSMVYVLYSDDDGRTWQRNSDGELNIIFDWNATFSYVNEPTVTEVMPGILLMMMRTGVGPHLPGMVPRQRRHLDPPVPDLPRIQHGPVPDSHPAHRPSPRRLEPGKRGGGQDGLQTARGSHLQSAATAGASGSSSRTSSPSTKRPASNPAPLSPLRPAEQHFRPGRPAPEREAEYVESADAHGRWSYPLRLRHEGPRHHRPHLHLLQAPSHGRHDNLRQRQGTRLEPEDESPPPQTGSTAALNPADNPMLRLQPGKFDIARAVEGARNDKPVRPEPVEGQSWGGFQTRPSPPTQPPPVIPRAQPAPYPDTGRESIFPLSGEPRSP